uniref:UTRA domain-containing protein n=1 Tax=Taenia asiatica TaxID=60517 RepID=A0A0R3W8Z2_TAEAS
LWLMIENIPETQQSLTLEFKNGDIVRWLNYDPKYLEPNPGPLPDDELLECETWSGECLVVPSENARLISSKLELAQLLQHRPRAVVVEAFVGTSSEELSVKVISNAEISAVLFGPIVIQNIYLTYFI